MRPTILLAPFYAFVTLTTGFNLPTVSSGEISQLTASAAALATSIENGATSLESGATSLKNQASSLINANPTSMINPAISEATAALHSLSKIAATAVGQVASSIRAEET